MDEQEPEIVNPREAALGVSALGGLTLLLGATIVYRIVESRPDQGPAPARPVVATADAQAQPAPLPAIEQDAAVKPAGHAVEQAEPQFPAPARE